MLTTLAALVLVGVPYVGLPHVGLPHVGLPHVGLPHVCLPHVGLPHDGPTRRIFALTRHMQAHGKTAALLHQRAICFLELRLPAAALKDLHAALHLDPGHQDALVEQVRVLSTLERAAAARAAAEAAADRVRKPALRALLARVHAEVLTGLGQYRDAIEQCQRSLEALPDQPRVVFRRSILRGLLDQPQRRLCELEQFVTGHPAPPPIVQAEWIDALIACGDHRAGPLVEAELRQCRFRSAWWLRRARILGGTAGDADRMRALRELSQRIHPRHPDLTLIADRALAVAGLGLDPAGDLALLERRGYPQLLLLQLRLRLRD